MIYSGFLWLLHGDFVHGFFAAGSVHAFGKPKTMKRLTLLAILFVLTLFFTHDLQAQASFSHSLGGSYYFSRDASTSGIMYSPRINLVRLDREVTLSLGTHFGFGLVFNSREGGSIALDVPILAEINFGNASNPDANSDVGGFVGAGYGISKIGQSGTFSDGFNDAAGIVINGGVIFTIKQRYSFGLRTSYLINFKPDNGGVFTLGAFYPISRK